MILNVTEELIEKGQRRNCGKCPIALAAEIAGIKSPQAGIIYIQGYVNGKHVRYLTPESVVEWMQDFDEGIFVEPIQIELVTM